MSWQVHLGKDAGVVSHVAICVAAAVLSGVVLIFAWSVSPYVTLPWAIFLYGAGLFQLTRRRMSFGPSASIGMLFGLLIASAGGFYEMVARNIVALSAVLSTISGPKDYTDAEAKIYFDHHEQTFTALVNLISQCEGKGTISIYPDGHVLRTMSDAVQCPPTNEISALLKTAKVLWVNVSGQKPYGELGPFGAMFVLSSRGIVGHGSGSAIYYFPELRSPFGDSFPLAGTPSHWFYHHL